MPRPIHLHLYHGKRKRRRKLEQIQRRLEVARPEDPAHPCILEIKVPRSKGEGRQRGSCCTPGAPLFEITSTRIPYPASTSSSTCLSPRPHEHTERLPSRRASAIPKCSNSMVRSTCNGIVQMWLPGTRTVPALTRDTDHGMARRTRMLAPTCVMVSAITAVRRRPVFASSSQSVYNAGIVQLFRASF